MLVPEGAGDLLVPLEWAGSDVKVVTHSLLELGHVTWSGSDCQLTLSPDLVFVKMVLDGPVPDGRLQLRVTPGDLIRDVGTSVTVPMEPTPSTSARACVVTSVDERCGPWVRFGTDDGEVHLPLPTADHYEVEVPVTSAEFEREAREYLRNTDENDPGHHALFELVEELFGSEGDTDGPGAPR